MFELMESKKDNIIIKVIGIGGGGGNAVSYMVNKNFNKNNIEFIYANTDKQALKNSNVKIQIQLGETLSNGFGAGSNPNLGRESANESKDKIKEILFGADMLFITAGMGGGTGTGASPVFAQISKELGILTVAVVTKPFLFEGKQRSLIAEDGIYQLSKYVDSLIVIPNSRLVTVLGKKITLVNAFKVVNDILFRAVKGISDLIVKPGLINVDFADIRTVMSKTGIAMIGTGSAFGDDRACRAAESAISSPFLEGINLSGARGILVNITSNESISVGEFQEVGDIVREFILDDATVIIGSVIDETVKEKIMVTVIITGLNNCFYIDKNQHNNMLLNFSRKSFIVPSRNNSSIFEFCKLDNSLMSKFKKNNLREATKLNGDLISNERDSLDIPNFLRKKDEKLE
ncbi:cell division protein FtsZ [Candidatus Legionella polyplacis]|uniref:cell division protein FtsZ n=1 Tax=Candidatus Legionella polyplacis TaxID=2005262 RepID=UPI000C1F81CB|nr:cell division protein FtsZ [Candidatus Legionella polyplacis]ATW01781.1 cell division protein FtsZ [Candidatus Legionella polyplacis]